MRRVLFLILSVLTLGGGDLLAQETRPIVQQIEVQYAGSPTVSRERILANMRTKVGEPYSDQVVESDIRNLYKSGSIANVRIYGETVTGGVKVVVVVQTQASVAKILIQGADRFKESRLRRELVVKEGELLNEANLEVDRQKLQDYYRSRGFAETTVSYDVQVEEGTEKATVTYAIIESGKMVVGDVGFDGNQALSDRELRAGLATKKKSLLSFLTKSGRVDQEKLTSDVDTIRQMYQNQGYIDVLVGAPRIEPLRGSKVRVVFPITEGPQYRVGTVSVAGGAVFPEEEIRAKIKTQPGGVYSAKTAQEDVKAVQDLYGTRGYVDLGVNADVISSGNNVVDIAYNLDEGAQSYIERVNISGNTRTKDKVIRRELLVAPGDVYDTVRVDASKARLGNLNYFSRVDTYPSDTGVPGRKDLNVLVEEKRTGSLNFGAGFSSIDNLIGFVEVQQSNFDVMGYPKFTGGGQRFRTKLQYGTQRKDFIIGLTEPYFLDYQLAVGGEIFYREANFVSAVYSQQNYGFEINARKPINNFTSLRLAYRLENINIFDVDDNVSEAIRSEAGARLKSGITAGLSYDTRDSVFLTRKGERIDFTSEVSGGPLGGDVQIYGFNVEASKYFLLPWDTIFLLNGQIGTVETWGGGDRVPIFDRLYLGGANNLRGFRFRDVSPKDENGEPIGGNTLARATVEYTFPVIEKVRGAVFYDVGFVNAGAYDFATSNVNSDFGLGVRLDLPIGPVRIDYGIPLQADASNDSSGRFNFNIGYQF